MLVAPRAVRHPINSQKESVGGPGLSGLQSNFISQLCKLLTGEAQPRLALEGEGGTDLLRQGPISSTCSSSPSLSLQLGLCLWGGQR